MRKAIDRGESKTNLPIAAMAGLVVTLGIFMILPFTQLFSGVRKEIMAIRQIDLALPPPPPPPEQPPPPEEKREETKPELKEKPKPLSLSQLELALNPGTGRAMVGDFTVNFETSGAAEGIRDINIKIFELAEVDKEPQLIYRPEPQYPAKLFREKVGGTVVVQFVVNENGGVTDMNIVRTSSYREFDKAATDAIIRYKFTPGIKDGQPVKTRYEQQITFTPQ